MSVSERWALFKLINKERKENGRGDLPPLQHPKTMQRHTTTVMRPLNDLLIRVTFDPGLEGIAAIEMAFKDPLQVWLDIANDVRVCTSASQLLFNPSPVVK